MWFQINMPMNRNSSTSPNIGMPTNSSVRRSDGFMCGACKCRFRTSNLNNQKKKKLNLFILYSFLITFFLFLSDLSSPSILSSKQDTYHRVREIRIVFSISNFFIRKRRRRARHVKRRKRVISGRFISVREFRFTKII
jgi:hypothetical protein